VSSKKQRMLEGPIHPIKVRFVSQKTIERAASTRREENIRGLYTPDDNLIYVNKEISEEEQLHVLFHELSHAIEFQVLGMDEEGRVEVIAKFLIQLAKLKSLKDVTWLT
jgi:Zn-dependent peptidase ImmA (M78 family)